VVEQHHCHHEAAQHVDGGDAFARGSTLRVHGRRATLLHLRAGVQFDRAEPRG
jgi:hypothetical protein